MIPASATSRFYFSFKFLLLPTHTLLSSTFHIPPLSLSPCIPPLFPSLFTLLQVFKPFLEPRVPGRSPGHPCLQSSHPSERCTRRGRGQESWGFELGGHSRVGGVCLDVWWDQVSHGKDNLSSPTPLDRPGTVGSVGLSQLQSHWANLVVEQHYFFLCLSACPYGQKTTKGKRTQSDIEISYTLLSMSSFHLL